jgi:hypothetical protein
MQGLQKHWRIGVTGLSQGGVIWMPLWLLRLDGIGTLYGVRMASQDDITSPSSIFYCYAVVILLENYILVACDILQGGVLLCRASFL